MSWNIGLTSILCLNPLDKITTVRTRQDQGHVVMVRKSNGKWMMCVDYTDPQGLLSTSPHRRTCGFNIRIQIPHFYGRFLGVLANQHVVSGPDSYFFLGGQMYLMLQRDAIRIEECWSNLSKNDE